MKRVLVTGATGFIGRHTLAPLLAKGYEVHATYHARPNHGEEHVYWHKANLLVDDEVARLINKVRPTHLLHFAWYVEHGKFWNAPENEAWYKASQQLINSFATHGGLRVVCAGTCAEYDWTSLNDIDLCDESHTRLNPNTLYGKYKYILYEALKTSQLNWAWGRIFFSYGPNEPTNKLVASVILTLLRGEVCKTSHGQQIRDFMYVKDIADAFVALLDSPVFGAVNIGSGKPVTLQHIIETIGDSLCRRDLIQLGALPIISSEPAALVANVSRLHSEGGWQPRYNLTEGITETIAGWRKPHE